MGALQTTALSFSLSLSLSLSLSESCVIPGSISPGRK